MTQHGINYQVPERVKSFRNNGAPFLPSSCSLTLTSSSAIFPFLTPGGEQNQGGRVWCRLRWSNGPFCCKFAHICLNIGIYFSCAGVVAQWLRRR